jgi:TolB-like protein
MARIRSWAITAALGATLAPVAGPIPAAAQARGKPVVAILDFTNSALLDHETYDPLRWGIAGMMITELQSNPNIQVVERERIRQVLDEIGLGKSGQVDPGTAAKAGKILGANHLILGAFVIDRKGNLRLDARAVNVESSVVEHVETVADDADNLLRAIARLGRQLGAGLKLPAAPAATPSPPAARRGQLLANLKLAQAMREEERKNATRAADLYRQFLDETPAEYAPLQRREVESRLARLTSGAN